MKKDFILNEIARRLTPGEIAERLYDDSSEITVDLEEHILHGLELFDDVLED